MTSRCFGVNPPNAMLGRSRLQFQTHYVPKSCTSSIVQNRYYASHSYRTVRFNR